MASPSQGPTPAPILVADYIVIGAGSTGAVIASRLTEDPDTSVILIEAGGEAKSLLVQLPVGFARMVANERFDWRYPQEPDPTIGGRHFIWSAGKMLGGGSSINGQVYARGTRGDFDRWARDGAPGWSFDEVLPYFKKSEHWHGAPSQAHGMLGPLSVAPMRDVHPLVPIFIRACQEAGIPLLDEYNAGDGEGVYRVVTTQRGGWRCSTEKAFLRPARKRPNLTVLTQAEAERIEIRDGRAKGVTFKRGGTQHYVEARREVILSAGSLSSPTLLMRSGIGDPALLREHGIPIQVASPSVGHNLQEHCSFNISKSVNRPTLNSEVGPLDMLRHAARYAFGRKGPFGAPAVQLMGLWRSDEHRSEPDLQFSFSPLSYDIDPDTTSAAMAAIPRDPAVSIYTSLAHPRSRGRVRLSAELRPVVSHRFFEDEEDLRTLVRGVRLIKRLYDTSAMNEIVTGNRRPNPMLETDNEWADFIRQKAAPNYHPCGTCRMGSDDGAVVDPQLKLRGLDGLRVADASIMPTVTSANTNAPSIMIGEKAADLIRQGEG
jgi:choline dehydrogenase